MQAFARTIRTARKAKGMRQTALAVSLGHAQSSMLSRIEAGDLPCPAALVRPLATALEIDPAWLARLWLADYQPEIAELIGIPPLKDDQ